MIVHGDDYRVEENDEYDEDFEHLPFDEPHYHSSEAAVSMEYKERSGVKLFIDKSNIVTYQKRFTVDPKTPDHVLFSLCSLRKTL